MFKLPLLQPCLMQPPSHVLARTRTLPILLISRHPNLSPPSPLPLPTASRPSCAAGCGLRGAGSRSAGEAGGSGHRALQLNNAAAADRRRCKNVSFPGESSSSLFSSRLPGGGLIRGCLWLVAQKAQGFLLVRTQRQEVLPFQAVVPSLTHPRWPTPDADPTPSL